MSAHLVKLKEEDVKDLLEILSDPESARLRMAKKIPTSELDCYQWLNWYESKSLERYRLFGVKLNDSSKLIGFCTAKPDTIGKSRFEVGIQISFETKKGYALNALTLLEEIITMELGAQEFSAKIYYENLTAQKLFSKLGYVGTELGELEQNIIYFVKSKKSDP